MVYLNNAASSWPKPEAVYRAVDQYLRSGGNGFGRSCGRENEAASEMIYDCRCNIAALFNIDQPQRIVFTFNATDAINIALKGFLKQGDHVIIGDMEHNSVVRPLCKMETEGKISLSIARSDENGMLRFDDIVKVLRDNTSLVIVSHVSNVTGASSLLSDIGAGCRGNGISFMVDASQSAGHADIDVRRDCIDILAAPGHKGLLGPQGTGMLYVAPHVELETLREGGSGGDSLSKFVPDYYPDRHESGTMNTAGIAGFNEGVKFVIEHDPLAIARKIYFLTEIIRTELRLLPGIRIYSPKRDSALFSFNIRGMDSMELCDLLSDKNIVTRGGFHCSYLAHQKCQTLDAGMLRISPGFFSTVDDVYQLIEQVQHICEKMKRTE